MLDYRTLKDYVGFFDTWSHRERRSIIWSAANMWRNGKITDEEFDDIMLTLKRRCEEDV